MERHNLLRLPAVFYDDHAARELDTPVAMRRTQRHVWVRRNDPALAELLSDARHYASPAGPDTPNLRRAARAVVRAVERT